MSESGQICGGFTDVEPSELPKLETKVADSLATLGTQANSPNFQLGKIISAKKQVVAGYVYLINAEVIDNGKPRVCKFRIWERPWTGERHVEIECDNKTFRVIRKDEPTQETEPTQD